MHVRLSCLASLWLTLAGTPAFAECANVDALAPLDTYGIGWGIDHRNTRYQPRSTLTANNASQLQLKWVYQLSNTTPRSQPLITEHTVFVGDAGRGVVALDRATGCERWLHPHYGQISSALVPARIDDQPAIVFNDRTQGVYAISAADGSRIWHLKVDDEPVPWYSGTPLVTADRVFVPVASMEVVLAANPLYGCCTTSGGMAAFDIRTGAKLWYRPTIAEPARETGSHWFFVQHYGPSGAPVWAAPAYDADRDRLYFGTGQNYTHPTTDSSDALIALDARDGTLLWQEQFTANDAYTAACNIEALNHPNCAKPTGPDVDFGAPVLLLKDPDGRELLVAGQKSAEVHAVNPQTGARLWTTRLGRGGIIGGVHWGLAANETMGLVFVPISDKEVPGFPSPGEPTPGLYALNLRDGSKQWQHQQPSRCEELSCVYGLSAAITAANDIVVAGSMDGILNVHNAATGQVLWTHDAWRDYEAVNGGTASGGAFDAHGPVLADNLLVTIAGYGYVGRQRGGNALLVFEVSDD